MPGNEPASSSHEGPALDHAAAEARFYEDREREEEQQREEDEELYAWHVQRQAQAAQQNDRAAVLAHLGWSTRTVRTVQVQVSHPKWGCTAAGASSSTRGACTSQSGRAGAHGDRVPVPRGASEQRRGATPAT